jgi:aspartate aminotransferase-like enzyme
VTKRKIVMIPGPTPVVRSIQNELGREVAAFGDPTFVADHLEMTENLKKMLNCDGEVFVVAASGTLGMEMAVSNVVKRGDSVLLTSNGFFGDRFIAICERKGLNTDIIQAEWGTTVTPEQVDEKMKTKKYSAVIVTHVDTSTGVCAPIEEISKVVHKYDDTLLIIDGVCATGGVDEDMQRLNLDVVFTGSQKAFGVPPGMTMVWANKKALARRETLGTIPEYYCDFKLWQPIMENPAKYFATPAINMVWALKEGVRIIMEEGLQNRYERHIKYAKAMQSALEALGFTLLAKPHCRAVTLSNPIYPQGIDDAAFRSAVYDEGINVGAGLAGYAGKMFRIGHMGNIDEHDMSAAIAAVERALIKVGYSFTPGTGVGALLKTLAE